MMGHRIDGVTDNISLPVVWYLVTYFMIHSLLGLFSFCDTRSAVKFPNSVAPTSNWQLVGYCTEPMSTNAQLSPSAERQRTCIIILIAGDLHSMRKNYQAYSVLNDLNYLLNRNRWENRFFFNNKKKHNCWTYFLIVNHLDTSVKPNRGLHDIPINNVFFNLIKKYGFVTNIIIKFVTNPYILIKLINYKIYFSIIND